LYSVPTSYGWIADDESDGNGVNGPAIPVAVTTDDHDLGAKHGLIHGWPQTADDHNMGWGHPGARRWWPTVTVVCLLSAGCGGSPSSPTAPSRGSLTPEVTNIVMRNGGTGSYRLSVTLRETAGISVNVTKVAVTVTAGSGATTTTEFAPSDLLQTPRIDPHGTVSTTVTVAAPVGRDSQVLSIRVMFIDYDGNVGSVDTSAGVKVDLTGAWTGALPIRTNPVANWSFARATLVQSGNMLEGELVSNDAKSFPLSGTLFELRVGGLTPGSITVQPCNAQLDLREFQINNGQVTHVFGSVRGRCGNTLAGNFVLQRG